MLEFAAVKRYVAMFDVLGFRRLVEENSLPSLAQIAKQFLYTSKGVTKGWPRALKRHIAEVRVFQDTVIAYSKGTQVADFAAILMYSKNLMRNSLVFRGLCMRGAITYGDIFSDRSLIVGRAISRVYEMETRQEWVGCWVDRCCLSRIRHRDDLMTVAWHYLAEYPIPLKTGPSQPEIVVNWAERSVVREWRKHMKRTLGSECSEDVKRKLQNTDVFLTAMTKRESAGAEL